MATAGMLLDWIASLSSAVENHRFTTKSVKWVALLPQREDEWGDILEPHAVIASGSMEALSKLDPSIATLLICENAESTYLETTRDNMIVAQTDLSPECFVAKLQKRIRRINEWEHNLDLVSANHCSYQVMLYLSEGILGNLITMTDSAYRLIAYTPNLQTDDEKTLELIHNGFHGERAIDTFRKNNLLAQWTSQTKTRYTPARYTKYPILNHVFTVNGAYFLQMVMTCNNVPYSQGLMDTFDILVSHINAHIRRASNSENANYSPGTQFLSDLVGGKHVPNRVIVQQMRSLGISDQEITRLYAIRGTSDGGENLEYVAHLISANIPSCYTVPQEDCVYLIACARSNNDGTWHTIEQALLNSLDLAYVNIAVSGTFKKLQDIHWGVKQTQIAFRYGKNRPYLAHDRLDRDDPFFRFENSLFDYLLFSEERDRTFLRFCLNSSPLAHLDKDRLKFPTDAEMLRSYLKHECSVSMTAEALGVHRNTVLNRISTLSETEDIDFDDPKVRINLTTLFHLSDLLNKSSSQRD